MSDLPLWYVIIINIKEATKVAAKDERLSHLPSSPMTEEIGNQGDSEAAPVFSRLFHWTAIGSEVWSSHGTGRPKVPFQEVLQARKTSKFLSSALLPQQKMHRRSELTTWTMFSCCTCSEVSFRPNQCVEGALVMMTMVSFHGKSCHKYGHIALWLLCFSLISWSICLKWMIYGRDWMWCSVVVTSGLHFVQNFPLCIFQTILACSLLLLGRLDCYLMPSLWFVCFSHRVMLIFNEF